MKDSGIPWIGEIPEGWRVEKGKSIFFQSKDKGNTKLTLLSATQKNGMQPQHLLNGVVQVKEDADLQTFKTVHKDDYVISLRSFQGGFEMSEYEGVCSPAYTVFRPREIINKRYYKYLFKTQPFIDKINSFYQGIREGKSIHFEEFSMMDIPIPPLSEQKAIAEFLDRKCEEIDEMVALQGKIIEELKAYKQSIITEAVTKGLDPNAPLKDSGIEWIGEIPEGWEIVPFKAIYSLGKGLSITKADLVENGIPVISYGQIHSKTNSGTTIKDEFIRFVPESYLEYNKSSLVKYGDIIFADTSEDLDGCGNCIFIDRDVTLFAGYHTIIANNHSVYHSNYFAYLFKTDCWRMQIRTEVNGVKLYSVPQRILSATSVVVPPSYVQEKIADYLDTKCSEIDALIQLKLQKIDSLKEYKKSIIYEYVTGKKEVAIG